MFTGIIEEIGILRKLSPSDGGYRIGIEANKVLVDTKIGDSIAVNGICLTVVQTDSRSFEADVIPETWRRSSLSRLKTSDKVNLERALLPTTRLGGHIVSGHIDGTARLIDRRQDGNSLWMTFEPEPFLMKYIAFKGSVAVEGTSLTVADVTRKDFSVGLIPATQEMTILSFLQTGDVVNIETDTLAKYVERLLQFHDVVPRPPLDLDYLKQHGYA